MVNLLEIQVNSKRWDAGREVFYKNSQSGQNGKGNCKIKVENIMMESRPEMARDLVFSDQDREIIQVVVVQQGYIARKMTLAIIKEKTGVGVV